jgi:hypothetical protein
MEENKPNVVIEIDTKNVGGNRCSFSFREDGMTPEDWESVVKVLLAAVQYSADKAIRASSVGPPPHSQSIILN